MNPKRAFTVVKKAVKFPVYLGQVFTGAKSFSANPIIGSRVLNIIGLHVARTVLAAAVTRFRMICLSHFATAEQRQAFQRDGFVLIKDFVPEAQFQSLNSEIRALKGEVRECVQGDTLTHRMLLTENVLDDLPACKNLLSNNRFSRLLRYTASRNNDPIYYVQSIKSNVVEGAADPQRTLHSDTFHPTMKAWLFLDDVSEKNGAFTYVAGSQRLSLKRLKWEYHNSVQGSSLANSYAARGSLRVTENDLETMGLQAPTEFKVPANTLVIANTNGFHRRGVATEVSNRMEIWAYSRTNPFNPLPGFNFSWYKKLSHLAIDKYLKRQDNIAQAKGAVASWHVVSPDALHKMPDDNATESKPERLPEVA